MKWVVIGIKALLTLAFVGAGSMKMMGAPDLVAQFELFGLPTALMYVVGACELAGAIGLWVKKTGVLASGGLCLLMLGAAANHVMAADPVTHPMSMAAPSVVLLLLSVVVTVLQLKQRQADA